MPSQLSKEATKPDRLTVRQVSHFPPPWFVPPSAETEIGAASAHTKAKPSSTLLVMVDSPEIEVVGGMDGRRPAPVDTEYTPARVRSLYDYDSFAALVMDAKFSEAEDFCRLWMLTAPDESIRVRWVNNVGIVKRAEGKPADSLTLLYSIHAAVERLSGLDRGRHHNNLGFTFQLLHKPDEALTEYLRASELHTDPVMKAGVNNNLGRLLTSMDAPAEAIKHLDEALKAAKEADDVLLRGEVLESFALAFEAGGEIKSARRAALSSVETLEGTGYRLAEEESRQTMLRLLGRTQA
jgi:tetratricopeptide (TPR) repeat protein